jgi:integrase/recombinase XerC/integrase/recombinase XerD
MVDERVKDRTYQQTPIGHRVKHWLQALQWEDAPQNTQDAYEIVGARLALEFPDLDLVDLTERGGDGVGKLRFFLTKHWGTAAPATRRARRSGLSSLFEWAVNEDIIEWNPVSRIKSPKVRGTQRQAHTQARLVELIHAQPNVRDQVCLGLLCRLGIRKEALRLMQARDVKRASGLIGFRMKGGGWAELPYTAFETLARDLDFLLQAEEYRPRDYLLHPKTNKSRPMDRSSVHRWFKRCLDRASLPDFPMHELRHSAADFTRRATDSYVAKDLLGHRSVQTTEIYLHSDLDELREKLEQVEVAWVDGVEMLRSEGL